MVDKITQPITPVEEIEKINEIIDDAEASKVSIEDSLNALAANSAKIDLSNLSTVGQEILDNKLNKQMISNCITEIPQDIKLELNNGTLTLKAGSKVYVPNGAGVFDEVTIANDVTMNGGAATGTELVYARIDGNLLIHYKDNSSGTDWTATSQYQCRYNTSANMIKNTNDTGSTWGNQYSFPIAKITISSGTITSIDQVFNGFGYIGSTIFALPNVKGSCPQGLNDVDGTLNNIEFTIPNVLIYTAESGNGLMYVGYRLDTGVIEVMYPPNWEFDFKQNKWIHKTNGFIRICKVAEYFRTTTSGKYVSEFNHKQSFRAVDYNDKSTIAGWGMPSNKYIDLTLGASGSKYTAPANGFYFLNKVSGAASRYVCFTNESAGGLAVEHKSQGTGDWMRVFMFAKKGDTIDLAYNVTGTTNQFRFIYAEGEQ